MLARSKLNSIESKISETVINNEIKHEDLAIIIDEEKKYRELKESIKMMNSQRSDAEKISLIEEGKIIVLMKFIYLLIYLFIYLFTYALIFIQDENVSIYNMYKKP